MDEIEPRLKGLMLAGLAGEAGPYRRLLDELSGLLRAYYRRRCPPGLARKRTSQTWSGALLRANVKRSPPPWW